MIHRKFRLLVALLAAFTLFLGACGDDDDSASAGDDVSADEDSASDGDDASDDSSDDPDDTASDDDDSDDDSGSPDVGALTGDCAFLGEFADSGLDEAFDEADPFTDGGAGFQALAEEFQEVADAAPGEIEEDFQTLAALMQEMAKAFADVDLSDPESFDPSAFEDFDEAKFEEAGQRIEAWMRENCPGAID